MRRIESKFGLIEINENIKIKSQEQKRSLNYEWL